MKTADLRQAYQAFFLKNEAGKQFIDNLNAVIDANHKKAENEPELARDYIQRAKGAREIADHINSLTAERKLIR